VSDVAGTFLWAEGIERSADSLPCRLHGASVGLAKKRLQLGEHQFDMVEIRAVWRQEEQLRAALMDRAAPRQTLAGCGNLASQIGCDTIQWLG
jgi:hypothetical protein